MTTDFNTLLDPGSRETVEASVPQQDAITTSEAPLGRGIAEVGRPRAFFGLPALVAVTAVLGGGVALAVTGSSGSPAVSPPAPEVPQAPAPKPPSDVAANAAQPTEAQSRSLQPLSPAVSTDVRALEARRKLDERLRSPLLIGDREATAHDVPAAAPASDATALLGNGTSTPSRARQLARLDALVAQGTLVAGVLETALNSDLPGLLRAVVAADVRSFDGRQTLIPRGSRLIGEYRSGLAVGQSRAFVVWTRLITPDGVSVDLASPGTDDLGRAGLTGRVDTHFIQRFGAALLLSVVGAAGQAGSNSAADGTSVMINSAGDASRVAELALQNQVSIPPTVKVRQGTPIRIFVARDLDFSRAGAAAAI